MASRIYRLDQKDKWRSAGMRGTSIIQIRMPDGRIGWVLNKYSSFWWEKATERDIRRVIVHGEPKSKRRG